MVLALFLVAIRMTLTPLDGLRRHLLDHNQCALVVVGVVVDDVPRVESASQLSRPLHAALYISLCI